MGQLKDGLTAFFADFRNRSIRFEHALVVVVVVVVVSISGQPDTEIKRLTDTYRQQDGK
jgi:predicted SnoaL-like aldol condensation-catalyzing enzyme